MHFNLSRWTRMMPILAVSLTALICAGAFIFSLIRPAGVVGSSQLVMARESGQVYVRVGERLHPALNLSSAKLIAGADNAPSGVKQSSINAYPIGAKVGISGAPDATPITNGPSVSVAVCQRSQLNSLSATAEVTVLNGGIEPAGRAPQMGAGDAIVGVFNGQSYLVFNGVKSLVDPNNRVVLGALGIDPTVALRPRHLSGAVANAIPSGLPLVTPAVASAGAPSPWDLGVRAPVGSVVQADLAGQGRQFFVVLLEGVQRIPGTVAAMLRSVDAFGLSSPPVVSPDALSAVPQVEVVQVSQYPGEPVRVVGTEDAPVLCWWWERGRGAPAATARILAGQELPIAASADAAVVPVVTARLGLDSADAVYMAADAANWVRATGQSASAPSKESMWWISRSGTRFGVPETGNDRQALGLTADPMVMPWVLLRLFPRGLPVNVALSKPDAMTIHNSLPAGDDPAALMPAG